MYTWIWRHLPGGLPAKMGGVFALLLGTLALLFFVIFPWIEPQLPFNHVNVSPGATTVPTEPFPTLTPTGPAATPTPANTPRRGPSPLPGD
jgi:hypothetical protein